MTMINNSTVFMFLCVFGGSLPLWPFLWEGGRGGRRKGGWCKGGMQDEERRLEGGRRTRRAGLQQEEGGNGRVCG